MLHTISAFDRLGEENAFAVLARATALAAEGKDIITLGRASLPFFLLMVVATALVTLFPDIVLSLPRAMTAR